MKCLVLILISCVAGCASSEAAHRHSGTTERALWQDDHNRREASRGYMLEGREGDRILKEPSPSRDFRRTHDD